MTEKDRGRERLDIGRRIVVFIGPEGAGKTIQAKQLARDTGKPYVTTSGILHFLKENDFGPVGNEVRIMFENHDYLSGERLLEVLGSHLQQREDIRDGQILDGGFRTVDETAGFRTMLETAGLSLPLIIIYLQVPEEESYKRLSKRNRSDDTLEGIARRLAKFNDGLGERLNIIRNQPGWVLEEIDATATIEAVYKKVVSKLLSPPYDPEP